MAERRKRLSYFAFTTNISAFHSNYSLKEVIGRGATSVIRLCTEIKSSKNFAVKIIEIAENMETIELIRNEIIILKQFSSHNNIITLQGVYESPEYILIIFEWISMGDFFEYLLNEITLSEKRAKLMFSQILEAIQYIHEKNFVHRDVKPENVLLDSAGNMKLADFGFACHIKTNQLLHDIIGTPMYMAPEIVDIYLNENSPGYERPVDCWAVGVMMFSAIVGTMPFFDTQMKELFNRISHAHIDWSQSPDISSQCKDVISKLLVCSPERRLTSKESLQHPFFQTSNISSTIPKMSSTIRRSIIFKDAPADLQSDASLSNEYKEFFDKDVDDANILDVIELIGLKLHGHWINKQLPNSRYCIYQNEL